MDVKSIRLRVAGGRNSRLDEIQAAILSAFLSDLDVANARCLLHITVSPFDILNIATPPVYGEESVARS
jgi:hypothetical protein